MMPGRDGVPVIGRARGRGLPAALEAVYATRMTPRNTTTLWSGILCLLVGVAGCDPCGQLEEKICNDLGEEDCKAWREAGGPDSLRSGKRAKRSCTNALGNYEPHLTGAKAIAKAQ
jgi:hypothetical protein